ncbi:MAG: hypothetical protein P8010_27160 [Desulfosarcinaceae bacterium]|jgi:K+ transporter
MQKPFLEIFSNILGSIREPLAVLEDILVHNSIFIFMSRNATDATSFFSLPADQVIEVGVCLEI